MIEHGHTEFEYPDNGEVTKDDAMAMLASALGEIFRWQANAGTDQLLGRPDAHAIGLRTAAALWVVAPEIVGNVSLVQLAEELGCSKSILSRYAVQFQDRFHFKGRCQRSAQTREKMRLARVEMPPAPANVSAN